MLTKQEQQNIEEQKLLELFRRITDARDRRTMLTDAETMAARQIDSAPKLRLVIGGDCTSAAG
jgi:hypothetical protein